MFARSNLWIAGSLLAVALTASHLTRTVQAEADKPATKSAPKVEVVFCLDTTGSMKGLLDRAKEKIWAISNQIASGKPSPDLKIGLVAYRDRGDDFTTKVFEMTDDLDAIHGHLQGFKAAGGGDIPESVNEALDVAVNKIKWSKDDDTLRLLFLVGDAPAHMDYKDDVKYPETCKRACEKGIIINTIQCGDDTECTKHWQDIARKSEGSYVKINKDGGVITVVETPFDKRLAEINGELAKSTVVYGEEKDQASSRAKATDAANLPAPAAAERALYNAKKEQNAAYDLVDAIKNGKVKLEDVKKEHLPPEMQKMNAKEQKEHLDKLDKQREELRKEALKLAKDRTDFINKKISEETKKSAFDGQVLEMLRKQAKKVKIDY